MCISVHIMICIAYMHFAVNTFFVISGTCCFSTCDSFQDESELLLRDGNCQLLALAHATGRYKDIVDIAADVTEENRLAASSGYRTYK